MNFSVRQWRALFVLDTLLKGSVAFVGAILASLGTVILGGFKAVMLFIAIGASISSLHLLGLFFGSGIIARLEAALPKLRPLKFLLVLAVANVLFVLGFTALMFVSLGESFDAPVSLLLTATNLISILLVAGPGCVLKLLDHLY
jgi:hypothetical protein